MLRFAVLSVLLVSAYAGSYHSRGYGGNAGGYGGSSGGYGASSGGYGAGLSSSGGYSGGLISAAVQSRRSVQFVDVPMQASAGAPLAIEVPSNSQPLTFLFRSKSSDINLQHVHEGSSGSYRETSSQDEPHVLVHTVTRPVVQELREIITPYRKVRQEIQPVQEEVQTVVSRGQQTGAASFGAQTQGGNYGSQGYSTGSQGYSSGAQGYGNGGY